MLIFNDDVHEDDKNIRFKIIKIHEMLKFMDSNGWEFMFQGENRRKYFV